MPGPGNVGERVRNLRLTRRLSQAQLAGHDLSDSYISLIESGKRTPTPAVLRLLAERLGCTPEYLAEGIEPEQRAHLEVRERYARLALRTGDSLTALSGFDDVIAGSDDPDLTARARWGRARALEGLGRIEAAIGVFEELREQAERDPGRSSSLPALVALARCYHAVGDLGQAIALGERVLTRLHELELALGREHTEAGRVLLLAYVDRSDPERAHQLGRRVLASGDPGDASVAAAYRNASALALEHSTVGDALYLADQALAAQGERARSRARARLQVAAARALLRGVPSFGETNHPAAEALHLLNDAAPGLEGAEAIACAIETARALVLLGEPEQAISTVERQLGDPGGRMRPPSATSIARPPGDTGQYGLAGQGGTAEQAGVARPGGEAGYPGEGWQAGAATAGETLDADEAGQGATDQAGAAGPGSEAGPGGAGEQAVPTGPIGEGWQARPAGAASPAGQGSETWDSGDAEPGAAEQPGMTSPASATGPGDAAGPVGATGPASTTGSRGSTDPASAAGPGGEIWQVGAAGPSGEAGPGGGAEQAGAGGGPGQGSRAPGAAAAGSARPGGEAWQAGAAGPGGEAWRPGSGGYVGEPGPAGAMGAVGEEHVGGAGSTGGAVDQGGLGGYGKPDAAAEANLRALQLVQARLVLARARLAQDDRDAALAVLRDVTQRIDRLGRPALGRPAAQVLRELGELFEAVGDGACATTAYRQALEAAGLRPTARPQPAPSCDLGVV